MNPFKLFRRRPDPCWTGMYRSFAEVPAHGPGWAGDAIDLESEIAAIAAGRRNPDLDEEMEALAAAVRRVASRPGPVRIVDFGGGAGTAYVWLRRHVPEVALRYVVVEVGAALQTGTELHAGDPAIEFRPDLALDERPDIVFAMSSLQYVDDYQQVLRDLFGLGAAVVVLEKFSGVPGPSYVSAQVNLPGSVLPYRFISFDEVFAIAEAAGYRRTLWRTLPREYPQDDVPPERRMNRASTLVFEAHRPPPDAERSRA